MLDSISFFFIFIPIKFFSTLIGCRFQNEWRESNNRFKKKKPSPRHLKSQ